MQLPPQRRPGTYRIAIVCLGNICRSPMAHVVLTDHLDRAGLSGQVAVDSAGTGGWHVGGRMDSRAAATLTAQGYDASRHRAAQFTSAQAEDHDLVLAMDAANFAELRELGVGQATTAGCGCSAISTPRGAATYPIPTSAATKASSGSWRWWNGPPTRS